MNSSGAKGAFLHRAPPSRLTVGPLCLLVASCLLIHSIASAPAIQAGGGMANFGDCMKNPFAPACRGISAKRSAPQTPLPDAVAATVADEEQQALNHWRTQILSERKATQLAELHWLMRLLSSGALSRQLTSQPIQPQQQQQLGDEQSLGALYQLLAIKQPQLAAIESTSSSRQSTGGNE